MCHIISKKERKEYRKKNRQYRKRETAILIKKEIAEQFNTREISVGKKEQIAAAELTIDGEKIAIIGIHTKPNSNKENKEKFYTKLRNIIENSIGQKSKVIMRGNTSKKEKEGLDKTIKKFCKKSN